MGKRTLMVMVVGLIEFFSVCVSATSVSSQTEKNSINSTTARGLDTTCSPCKNFYQFANGNWIKNNPVPPAYSRWGSFEELAERNEQNLKAILQKAAAKRHTETNNALRNIGNYYAACMDTAGAEARGHTPLIPYLKEIDSMSGNVDVPRVIASMHRRGIPAGFRFSWTADARNSTMAVGWATQAGLGLPDRDLYLRIDSPVVSIRAAYEQYVTNMLKLLGEPDSLAAANARKIIALETELASATMTRVEKRDPGKTYNLMTREQLLVPGMVWNWNNYFAGAGRTDISSVNVESPRFMAKLDSLLVSLPVDDWKAYLRFHTVHGGASMLSSAFVKEQFRLTQKISGEKEQLPREKRCIKATDANLGEELGQAYVAEYFPPEAKGRVLNMVRNLKAAFQERIKNVSWMSDSTRVAALAKLNAITDKIGYPDKWRNQGRLQLGDNPYFDLVMEIRQFGFKRDLERIGKPIDRTEWSSSPPTVNAYYNPSMNQIIFPAGILQPPFFDPKADDAINYGGMGAVIGHEITHGFDDKGRQYDAQGNLRSWWGESDANKFKTLAQGIVEQFNGYTVLDSLPVQGSQTIGENIADLGGLSIAYDALQKSMKGKPRPRLVDGFTAEQRFFLGWARMWRSNITPEAQRLRLATDNHAPAIWRTNGPLSNMPEFAKAWGCKEGDAMVRNAGQRAAIW